MFAPSPSLYFSVHLSFFFISCFYPRVFKCLKLLYKGKECKVDAKQFAIDRTTFKVEENSRTVQGLTQKFKDFPKEIEFKDFSRLREPRLITQRDQRSLRDSTILYGVCVGEMLVLKAICDALTH